MRPSRLLSLLAAAGIATLANARDQDVRLPDIGSSAAGMVSPQDMHDYGAGALQEMRSLGMVLDDALLNDYITGLGYRLVANSDHPKLRFTFFIMNEAQINAFAMPGGFVAANAGLITAMSREDELAGVLAHEISHVEQQHILRAFEDARKMSIPIMLAMLGVLAVSAGRNDDAAPAALAAGTSLMQQRQINFTRSEEAEADRFGIQILARAGFDPNAMASAFQALQRVMRVNGIDIPEFLLDHPLDTKRIAEARERASQLGCPTTRPVPQAPAVKRDGPLNLALPADRTDADSSLPDEAAAIAASNAATTKVADSADEAGALPTVSVTACAARGPAVQGYFELMRERARVLSAPSQSAMRGYYADNLRDNPSFDTVANRYGYALALLRSGNADAALAELRKLAQAQPDSAPIGLAFAAALDLAGNRAESIKVYERAYANFPGNRAVTMAFADGLLGQGGEANAKRALELLRPLIARYAEDPDLHKSFGRANQLAGDKVRAAEAYAEAAWLTGHPEDALNQLKALSKQGDLTYYQRSRIDARITQLTPAVLALRKRYSPESDEPKSLAPAWREPPGLRLRTGSR